jgi:hypothetical protein
MFSRIDRALISAALLLSGATVTEVVARTVKTIAPITPWNVDYADKTCTLRRGFGDAADRDILLIEQFGPTRDFQLLLMTNELSSYDQGEALWVRFGPYDRTRARHPLPGRLKTGKSVVTISSASLATNWAQVLNDPNLTEDDALPASPAREAGATNISIELSTKTLVFATGPLDKPMAALRTCTDNLVKSWGLDPSQQAKLTKRAAPLTKPSTWILSEDYPSSMLVRGKQALVNFRLNVDAEGLPTACEVQRSYSDPEFDRVTCNHLMKRARFSPALDESGRAVQSYYLNSVSWIMQI